MRTNLTQGHVTRPALVLHPCTLKQSVCPAPQAPPPVPSWVQALLAAKAEMGHPAYLEETWVQGTNPCDPVMPWVGITCDPATQLPTQINFPLGTLTVADGTPLPDSLAGVTSLRNINFHEANFEGPLPRRWGALTNIANLGLTANRLEGGAACGALG